MKKLFVLCSTLLLLFSFQRCNQEDQTPSIKTKVTFGFSTPDAINGRKQTDLSDSTTLFISIETSTGESVFSHHSLKLLSFGNGYVTDPIELFPGDYVITEFMLVNNSDVQYATPQQGSPLSPLVKHPLPVDFRVELNKVDNIQMEVISVDEHTSQDFGYASFHINIVRPLLLSVFTQGNTPKITTAKAYLLKDADTLATYSLGAKVNTLLFKRDPQETYKLIIQKDGYTIFSKTFVYNELIAELNGHPLNAYLEPALTMRLSVKTFQNGHVNTSGTIGFLLHVSSDANFTINWDDGAIQPVSIRVGDYTVFEHNFNLGSYYIAITGDLTKLIDYTGAGADGVTVKIDFENLSALRVLNLFQGPTLDVLDLRKNKNIEHLVFGGKTLLLPDESNLKIVIVYGYDLIPQLDYIIDNVYTNAVAKNIFNGVFEFDDNPDSGNPIGNPSAESLWKIEQLKDVYDWQFYP